MLVAHLKHICHIIIQDSHGARNCIKVLTFISGCFQRRKKKTMNYTLNHLVHFSHYWSEIITQLLEKLAMIRHTGQITPVGGHCQLADIFTAP